MGVRIAKDTKEGDSSESDVSPVDQTYNSNSQIKSRLEALLRSQQVIDQIHDAVIATDLDGNVISWNKGAERQFGYASSEILDHPIYHLYPEERQNHLTLDVLAILKDKGTFENEAVMQKKSGEIFIAHSSLSSLTDETGEFIGIISYSLDITERKNIEKSLKESEEKYSDLVTNIPGAVYRCENNSRWSMEYISPNISIICGYPAEDFINNKKRTFASIIHPDDRNIVEQKVVEGLKEKEPYVINYRILHKDSNIRWVYEKGQGIFSKDGELIYLDGVIFDNTESHELSEKLSFQATHDVLTGLVNRAEFEHRLKRILLTLSKDNSEHALLYLDLDQFKLINDTSGHVAGDELLRQLGLLLSKCVRKRDTVARLGGDEFGVLMEHCSLSQAKRVANKLKKEINQFRFVWEKNQFNVGASIGLVVIDEMTGSVIDLLKKADAACYAAKDQGRNRIHIYKTDDEQLAKQHGEMQWVPIINKALEENMFHLVYQPMIPLKMPKSKTINNRHELLLRLQLDDEIILPGKFLPAAERYNISEKIDRWVITTAFTYFGKNTELLSSTDEIAINISGQSISDDNFLNFIETAFKKHNIPQGKICFEITETAAIANLAKANVFIDTLKRLGCKFALDDFGSGLSSFAYLKTLHVDYLKIDGLFVKDIGNDPIDFAMVKSINEIGHEMGLQTIGEFVESKKILDKLNKIGVDYAQGFYFGQVQKLSEINKFE